MHHIVYTLFRVQRPHSIDAIEFNHESRIAKLEVWVKAIAAIQVIAIGIDNPSAAAVLLKVFGL